MTYHRNEWRKIKSMDLNEIKVRFSEAVGGKSKVLIVGTALLALTCILGVLMGLTIRLFGYESGLMRMFFFFNGLPSKVGFALLAYYVWGIWRSGKNKLYLVAAVLLLIQMLMGFQRINNWGFLIIVCALPLVIAVMLLGYAASQSEDDGQRQTAQLTMASGGGYFVLNVIYRLVLMRVGFSSFLLNGIMILLLNLALLVILALVFLLLSKQTYVSPVSRESVSGVAGGAASILGEMSSKLNNVAQNGRERETPSEEGEAAPKSDSTASAQIETEPDMPDEVKRAVETAVLKHSAAASVSGGWEYKTIAGPVALTVSKKDSYNQGVRTYADIIQSEAVGGWEFSHIQEIPVTKSPGCLGALMGKRGTTLFFNMLVFRRVK